MDVHDNLLDSNPRLAAFSSLSPHWHRLIVVLAAVVLTLPCLVSGIPVDGDAITHVRYQHHFSDQFWAGNLYPRWMMNSNKGYGSPIFLVQYPLPYWTTALLRPIVRFRPGPTREARELGVFCVLALVAAGLAARAWLSNRFGPLAATAGAIVYIALPYILATQLYRSAAIGQLSASVWMPLVLAACESLRPRFSSVGTLGIVFALLVMSNLITSVLFLPLMIGYALACRESRMSLSRCIASLFFGLLIGFGLAGVYLLPVIVYRRLFDLGAMAFYFPGFEVSHNFSFMRGTSLKYPLIAVAVINAAIVTGIAACYAFMARKDRGRVYMLLLLASGATMLVPGLGLALIRVSGLNASTFDARDFFPEQVLTTTLSTLALGILAYSSLSEKAVRWQDRVLFLAACSSFFLMLPWSAFVWKAAPELATAIQFPHRFGAILALAVAGLFAAAIEFGLRHRPSREGVRSLAIVTLTAIFVIASGGLTWRTGWRWARGLRSRVVYAYDESVDVDYMYPTYVPRNRVVEFARLVGMTLKSYSVEPTPVTRSSPVFVEGRGTAEVSSRDSQNVVVSYDAAENSVMQFDQLYWPLWKGALLDQPSSHVDLRSSHEALVELPLVPGTHRLNLRLDMGWPERCGVILTILSLIIVAGGVGFEVYSKERVHQTGAVG